MGVDLTICPDKWESMKRQVAGDKHGTAMMPLLYDRIGFTRQRDLWDIINGVPKKAIASVYWYGDDGLKEIATDPYGSPLTCCRAADLVRAMVSSDVDLYPDNRAILAYLKSLDPDHLILLYWH